MPANSPFATRIPDSNDGELAQRLSHPRFGVRKVYRVTVAGKVDTETLRLMRRGIYIAEGFVKVEGAKLLKTRSRATEMEIVLREGKNREIRRILARLGHKVQHLRRIAVGPLKLGDVPPGAYRVVRRDEVEKLWQATRQADPRRNPEVAPRSREKGSGKRQPRRGVSRQHGEKRAAPSFPTIMVEATAPAETPPAENGAAGTIIGGEPLSGGNPPKASRRRKPKRDGRRGGAGSTATARRHQQSPRNQASPKRRKRSKP